MTITMTTTLSLLLLLSFLLPPTMAASYFSVVDYGAKPNGKDDATKPFLATWSAACAHTAPAIVYVPNGKYMLKTVVFKGPCKSSTIGFRIDGTIIASPDYTKFDPLGRWIEFDYVDGLVVYGGGTIDGQGGYLWNCKEKGGNCPIGAKSLSIGHCKNVKISGITSINSQFFHFFIYGSTGVTVQGCKFTAPGDSPNTDGIHVQESKDITITSSDIRTGDDCISIGPGTSNVWIEGVFCGPGHGISIGSLANQLNENGVQNITVKTVMMVGTTNGLRIKSWAKPSTGFVKDVVFQNIKMKDVFNPIIIDQHYCPWYYGCPNEQSGININGVVYDNIQGTSATAVAVEFDCSPKNPCKDVTLRNINLKYKNKPTLSTCSNILGTSLNVIAPQSCLI